MKQIIFKSLHIKNFLSVGSEPLIIDFENGLNIITGLNYDKEDSKNGVGKSLIPEALYFALFGDTIRELKKEEIVNNSNQKNCKVSISFNVVDNNGIDEYILTRGILPTVLKFQKNGEDCSESSIPKTSEKIIEILGANQEYFQNAVIMSVNNAIPFMAQKKVDKRKFIEGMLNLSIFSEMLNIARQNYNDAKRNADIEQSKISEVTKAIEIYAKQQNSQKEYRESRIKKLFDRQTNNIKELDILKPTLKETPEKEINECTENIKILVQKDLECQNKIKEIINNNAELNQSRKNLLGRIEEINNYGDICIKCKRTFDTNDKKKQEEEIKDLNIQSDVLREKIYINLKTLRETEELKEKCTKAIETQKDRIRNLEIEINNIKNTKNRIEQLESWQKQLVIDISNLQNEHDEFKDIINETTTRLNTINTQLDTIKNKLNILDNVKFVVSEEGIKSYIVKKVLKILNGKLAYYLKKLDAPCTCEFNEYFEEKIINDKKQECSYNNFSGGERRRIDLAMLFTFMDIKKLQGNVHINVSFYDEILDSSLDLVGINKFIDILVDKVEKYKECVYIITHNDNILKHEKVNKPLYIVKKGGFTFKENKI